MLFQTNTITEHTAFTKQLMNPYFYSDTISSFLAASTNEIFGAISRNSNFPDDPTQKGAWTQEIRILKEVLKDQQGKIFFE